MAADDFRDEGLQDFYDRISEVAALTLNERLGNDSNPPSEFDSYRSLADARIMILVTKDVVPPFRFKAGWLGIRENIDPDWSVSGRPSCTKGVLHVPRE